MFGTINGRKVFVLDPSGNTLPARAARAAIRAYARIIRQAQPDVGEMLTNWCDAELEKCWLAGKRGRRERASVRREKEFAKYRRRVSKDLMIRVAGHRFQLPYRTPYVHLVGQDVKVHWAPERPRTAIIIHGDSSYEVVEDMLKKVNAA